MKTCIIVLIIMTQLVSYATADDSDVKAQATSAIAAGKFDEAYALIIEDATNGDSELQHTVALIISNGYGPIKQEDRNKTVLEWLFKSANKGFAPSQNWLADAYENGWFGLEKNTELAKCWRSKSNRGKLGSS